MSYWKPVSQGRLVIQNRGLSKQVSLYCSVYISFMLQLGIITISDSSVACERRNVCRQFRWGWGECVEAICIQQCVRMGVFCCGDETWFETVFDALGTLTYSLLNYHRYNGSQNNSHFVWLCGHWLQWKKEISFVLLYSSLSMPLTRIYRFLNPNFSVTSMEIQWDLSGTTTINVKKKWS